MIGGVTSSTTITIVRPTFAPDAHGNSSAIWDAATETISPGWAVDFDGSTEDTEHRDGSSATYVLRGPYAADVRATDRVRVDGVLYLIDGDVGRQRGPSARTSHTIVRLTRWEG